MEPTGDPIEGADGGLVADIEGLDAVHRHVASERRIGPDGEQDLLQVQRAVTHGILKIVTAVQGVHRDSQRCNERRCLENRAGLGRGKAIEKLAFQWG